MSEINKTYEPQTVEEKWYSRWLADDCFKADPASAKPAYSIVIPPPNVTGVLTLGHVLNNTIQDILARRARMLGKEVLWVPGTDHAGIATQTVVERTLKKQGVIRHRDDLGREKFLEKVWEWKEKHGGIIIQQLKKLGASCDWSRERFTMDPEYSKCVQQVFVDLYNKGLIYRGKRMVNWCPVSLTALSDEEVTMKPQNGVLYYFKVEVIGGDSGPATWLTIATTRPETIPGDTAIAVNPKDPRYAHLIGKQVRRPLPVQIPDDQKLIPIIGDEHVDFAFGTGVLKVTPAHDKADFEIGARHGLAAIDIMNPDGTMNAQAGESLVGLDRFEARNVAVDHLRELGVLEKEEPYQNNVGYSERADVPIEPRLSEQWFLKYPSVEKARNAVLAPGSIGVAPVGDGVPAITNLSDGPASPEVRCSGSPVLPGAGGAPMRFFPERWAKVYDHWMDGIQDWCISRQLWWGHRIPVWYSKSEGEKIHVGIEPPDDSENWIQDSDVLDTCLAVQLTQAADL
ncbi:MAG: class I tRNA ligase family protein, partial [Verrucomicrobiota bacterium]